MHEYEYEYGYGCTRHLDGAVAQAADDVDGLLVAALDAGDAQVRHHLMRCQGKGVYHGEGSLATY